MPVAFYRRPAFWLVFAIPNIMALLYFTLIADRQYVSEAPLIVYQAGQGGGVQSVNLSGSGASLEGLYLLQAHLRSWDCFAKLDPKKLEAHWSQGDFVTRYGGLLNLFQRSPSRLWEYYRSHVDPVVDEETGILKLQVTGYDPRFVQNVAQSVLNSSVPALNRLKQQSFDSSAEYMRTQNARDRAGLNLAVKQLSSLKQAYGVVDPGAAYNSKLTLANDLDSKIAGLSSQISIVRASTPNSEQLANLVSEQRGLQAKAGVVKQELGRLVHMVRDLDALQNEVRSAQERVSTTEAQYLTAQQEMLNSRYFIGIISPPNKPLDSTKPDRLFWIFVILTATGVVYLIVK